MTNPMTKQKTILIADDEKDLVKVLKFRLEQQGYKVLTADNGEEALKSVKKTSPDLVVLDISMPVMDGIEFYKAVSSKHGKTEFPILMLSAHGEMQDVFKQIDVDGFMTKPFEMNDLFSEVERILSHPYSGVVFLMDSLDSAGALDIRSALEKERYCVFQAQTLEEVLSLAEGKQPDFILMEYLQDKMHGDEMIKQFKDHFHTEGVKPSLPIIVYSLTGMDYAEKALQSGASEYLGKPESPDALITVMRGYEIEQKNTTS